MAESIGSFRFLAKNNFSKQEFDLINIKNKVTRTMGCR